MTTRVLFLGLDAADPDLLETWAGAGHLPTIKRLLEASAHGSTINPPGLYVGAVWPSFTTSVSPARHTRYCYSQIVPGNYDSKPFRPTDLKAPFFWEALSRAGQRLAVIDVPKVAIAGEGFNGVQIADWGSHDPEYGSAKIWPPSLAEDILSSFGRNPVRDCNGVRETSDDYAALRDMLVDRVGRKTRLIESILEQETWDAVLAVFSESHCVGHQCWLIHDESHPRHDPELRARCGDPVFDVYVALDKALGKLLAGVDEQTHCIVLASHGMGPHYDASYLLDRILESCERSRYPKSGARVGATPATSTLKRLWHRLPQHLRHRLGPARRAAKSVGITPLAGRRYFQVPNNDVFGAVRINLMGREPLGKVKPGAELEQVCTRLSDDLRSLVNVETGQKLVKSVLRTADVYSGPHLDYLPDLMIEWDRSAPIRQIYSPRIGTISGEYTGCRTGDHKPRGLFFATGPGIQPGPVDKSVSVMDFGPTIAAMLQVPLPDVDGAPIPRLQPSGC